MILPRNFNYTRTADMALFVLKNRTNLEDALMELADSLAVTLGNTNAYAQVASMLHGAAGMPGCFTPARERELRSIAGDLRELVGLPRHTYNADPTAAMDAIIRTAPAAIRPHVAAEAAKVARMFHG